MIKQHPSPNFAPRPHGTGIQTIVLHYTNMQDAEKALSRLCDPVAKVSAHYVIDVSGHIFQLVADDQTAWHAGLSFWRGIRNVNATSIGIELVNTGDAYGLVDYPEPQINALLSLLNELKTRYAIDPRQIVGHSDVAPSRKIDPGPLFPWSKLASTGLCVKLPDIAPTCSDIRAALNTIGYDPDAPLVDCIRAFNLRWCARSLAVDDDLFRTQLAKANLAMR